MTFTFPPLWPGFIWGSKALRTCISQLQRREVWLQDSALDRGPTGVLEGEVELRLGASKDFLRKGNLLPSSSQTPGIYEVMAGIQRPSRATRQTWEGGHTTEEWGREMEGSCVLNTMEPCAACLTSGSFYSRQKYTLIRVSLWVWVSVIATKPNSYWNMLLLQNFLGCFCLFSFLHET